MIELRVTGISTVHEPSATASTTTTFAGFPDTAALEAYGNQPR